MAVAARTTGLTAGAESRNASAAAGVIPLRTNAPATGTEPHSQPGSTNPVAAAAGTANTGLRGNALTKNDRGTKTAMAADNATPNARNGKACNTMDTNTVAQVCTTGARKTPPNTPRTTKTTSRSPANTSTDPILRRTSGTVALMNGASPRSPEP
nr:hypothetical protein GCM10017745_33760 [Saccharothrix mutabilis subsp. capreolus]